MRRTIREYRNAVPKLRKLSWRAWRDLASAQIALIGAQFRVWTTETGRLTMPETEPAPAFVAPDASIMHSKTLALAISRAATYGVFRPACLVRSVSLCRLMERRGIHGAVVRVGVVKRGAGLHAHAWVEYGGIILGDDPVNVSDYAVLPGITVLHAD